MPRDNAGYGVNPALLRFEVGAHEDLSDQSGSHQLYARQCKDGSQQQQRPVLDENGKPVQLFPEDENETAPAGRQRERAQGSEEVQWARQILADEAHGDQVECDANSSAEAVMRAAGG